MVYAAINEKPVLGWTPPEPVEATRYMVAPIGIGGCIPEVAVDSSVYEDRLGLERGWFTSRTHIQRRQFMTEGQKHHELATVAALAALKDAGIEATDLDAVICATITSHDVTPAAAVYVAEAIGAGKVAAFDIASACSGFVTALAVASDMVRAGTFRTVLLLGVDTLGKFVDPNDKMTGPLFADGGGAIVLRQQGLEESPGRSEGSVSGSVGRPVMGADGTLAATVRIPRGAPLEMKGHDTYLTAVNHFAELVQETAKLNDAEVADFDLVVLHQANGRIIEAVKRRLQIAEDRMVSTIAFHGNTSAGSIPLALNQMREEGKLVAGTKLLLAGFGAGIAWAGITMTWGEKVE